MKAVVDRWCEGGWRLVAGGWLPSLTFLMLSLIFNSNNLPSWCALSFEEIITWKVSFFFKNEYLRLNGNDFKSGFGDWTLEGMVRCGKGQRWVVFSADLGRNRLKTGRGMQGWKIGRWSGGNRGCYYLFRLFKRKDTFMKTNMTGDIDTTRL